jgi:putative peptide zinc metalloprotease protein
MSQHPRLRPDLVIVEQTYRGEVSYVVKDPATHKYFRFRALEIAVMQEFDGKRSVAEIAVALTESGVPIKAGVVENFARKLKEMGLIERSLSERSVLLLERMRADRRRRLKPDTAYRGSLLRMRWSIGDPDQWLERMLPRVRFMFTPAFVGGSILLFLVYTAICAANWPVFSDALARLYTPSRYTVGLIATFYLTGIVIIAIHELGHAFTCKYFGGKVNEMGAMLIYFEPAFYCNVNDSWTFPELRQRMWVTAAGSWIQMVIAALAAIVWWFTTPGTLVNDIAVTGVLIGGITTVLANANPLIPLDGYYALSDYLEVPNLRQRAFGYLSWAFKRRVLGLSVPRPPASDRERRVFLTYGILATGYITFIFWFIGGLVFGWMSGLLGVLGALLFLTGIYLMSRNALRRGVQLVVTSVREHRGRWRSRKFRRWVLGGAIAVVLLALVPWPLTVSGQFHAAAWPTLELVAPESGLIDRVFVTEGMSAPTGAPIIRLRNSRLERQAVEQRRARDSLALLSVQSRANGNPGESQQYAEEAAGLSAELRGTEMRLQSLTLRAPVRSTVATARLEESVGAPTQRGTVVARLLGRDSMELRIALRGPGAGEVRPGQRARLIAYGNPGESLVAVISTVAARSDSARNELEARVRIPSPAEYWRPGVTGEAEVVLARGTIAQALWRAVRNRIRGDLLL